MSGMHPGHIIVSLIIGVILATPFLALLLLEADVTIEKPFYKEYSECQEKLADAKEKTKCECDCGSAGLAYSIMGV